MTYYLRVEAVNFDNFLEDTHDLSTVRGGGLLMLKAVEMLEEKVGLTKVYTGASTGLFTFEAENEAAAEAKRAAVEKELHRSELEAGTLMVDILAQGAQSTTELQARLTTRNRLRQMRSPTVIMPAEVGSLVCDVNDLHPASPEPVFRKGATFLAAQGKKMYVSSAVRERRECGLEEKFNFYKKQTGLPHEQYVNDLDQLTDHPNQGLLHHKLALIYLDGNDFGKILRECKDDPLLGKWSQLLKDNQNEFLKYVLTHALTDPSWQWNGDVVSNEGARFEKKKAIRLETLLWGGDEIIWVVPAWKGWWMLGEFFRLYGHVAGQPARTTFSPDGKTKVPLTHGASIVFAHHNAPIHRLTKLAKELAEAPKKRGKQGGVYGNWFTYQVLESFDHLGMDPQAAREARLPANVPADALCLPGDSMHEVPALIEKFRDKFPKTQLHSLTRGGPGHRKTIDLEDATKVLVKYDLAGDFKTLGQALGSASDEAVWFHLAELWEYAHA